jgi:hypothetical protein
VDATLVGAAMNRRELKRFRKQINRELNQKQRELKRVEAKIVEAKRKRAEWYHRASLEAVRGKDGQTRVEALKLASHLLPED